MTNTTPGPLLADCRRPRSDRPVRLCVIADPHVTATGTGTWKMAHRSETLFGRAVAVANRLDPTLTLLAGDLTGDGRPASFDAVDTALAALDHPWVAVPGNHDVPKAFDDHEPPASSFEARYGELPTVLGAGPVSVLAVNTASAPDGSLRTTWGGRLGERDRTWLAETLPDVEIPILLCHHNVGALPDAPSGKFRQFQLRDADAVRQLLTDQRVGLAITGHHHVPAVLTHDTTTEVLSPAVCSYPHAMATVDIDTDGTRVRLVPLASRAEVSEARCAAVTGKPLARGVATLVDRRLNSLGE
jgi:3',5'-cyclic AMP phosphodiesterase CpdA